MHWNSCTLNDYDEFDHCQVKYHFSSNIINIFSCLAATDPPTLLPASFIPRTYNEL